MEKLTGGQYKQLTDALITAFPAEAKLAQMVKFGLGKTLAAIAGGQDLTDVVFHLIQWAEAQGRTEDLIVAARNENPGNAALRQFAEQVALAAESGELERRVLESVGFADVEGWREQMSRRE